MNLIEILLAFFNPNKKYDNAIKSRDIVNGKAWCRDCKKWQPVGEFYAKRTNIKGVQPMCKAARKIRNAAKSKEHAGDGKYVRKDGHHTVYRLKSGYIGETNNLRNRMNNHKSQHNRIVDDYHVLKTCDTKSEALYWEAYYQNESDHYKKPDNPKHLIKNKNYDLPKSA